MGVVLRVTVDAHAARRRANERLDVDQECDLGPNDGPCDECIQSRELARDVLALAVRLEAAETRAKVAEDAIDVFKEQADLQEERAEAAETALRDACAVGGTRMSCICEKCASDDIAVTYHRRGCDREVCSCTPHCGYGSHGKEHDEHLHYNCRVCRFDWTGPIAPFARSGEHG